MARRYPISRFALLGMTLRRLYVYIAISRLKRRENINSLLRFQKLNEQMPNCPVVS